MIFLLLLSITRIAWSESASSAISDVSSISQVSAETSLPSYTAYSTVSTALATSTVFVSSVAPPSSSATSIARYYSSTVSLPSSSPSSASRTQPPSTATATTSASTRTATLDALPTAYPMGATFATPNTDKPPTGIADLGYSTGSAESGGFISGWYGSTYWRVVAGSPPYAVGTRVDTPSRRGGRKRGAATAESGLEFSTRGLDQGFPGTRAMLAADGETLFCRALAAGGSVSAAAAPVACVRFDAATGAVASAAYLQGALGPFAAFAVRRAAVLRPELRSIAGLADAGAADSAAFEVTRGFRRGWYVNTYWRVCGAHPNQYVAGGIVGNEYQYSTYGLDQGVPGTLVVADVPGVGVTFCRGVGDNTADPFMACVLFAGDKVADQYGLYQQLGQWSQYASQLP